MSAQMVKDDFEQALATIQKEEDLKCEFDAAVLATIRCRDGIAVGLANGKIGVVKLGNVLETTMMTTSHSSTVFCLVQTPDGSKLISGSEDMTVRVWNLTDHSEEAKFEGHTAEVNCLAITPNGSLVVSGSSDSTVRVWNLAERKEEIKFEGHTKRVNCVIVTPDGSKVISGSGDETICIWNLAQRKLETTLRRHSGAISCLAITLDKLKLISGSNDARIGLWSLASGEIENGFKGHSRGVQCIALTADGSKLVSGSRDNSVRVWDIKECREEFNFEGHTSDVTSIAVTPDGLKVVSSSLDKTVRVWNLVEHREEAKFDRHSNYVACVAIAADGSVVSGSVDKTLRVYRLAECAEDVNLEGRDCDPSQLAITKDGSRLISADNNGFIRVRNLADRREEMRIKVITLSVTCMALMPDESRVISCTQLGDIKIWNLADGKEESMLKGQSRAVTCISITADGSRIAFGCEDKTVRVWSFVENKEEFKLEASSKFLKCVAITPDGSRVVFSSDSIIQVRCLTDGKEEPNLEGHSRGVACVLVTPDGSRVVSSSYDGTVRVWNLAEHREEIRFEGHENAVNWISITADGLRVVSASSDASVRVWNLAERRVELILERPKQRVTCVAISRDGSKLVSGSHDNICMTNLSQYINPGPIATNTPSDLREAINVWKNGISLPSSMAKRTYPSHRFNGLHLCAFYNRFTLLAEYMKAGVQLISGQYGTPLTLALQRNSIKCVDVILNYFITRIEEMGDKIWPQFQVINDDLPQLLTCQSLLLKTFFDVLMQVPRVPILPEFIVPVQPLPLTVLLSSRYADIADYDEASQKPKDEAKAQEKAESVLVRFLISLPRWNLTAGSNQSIELLTAFAECEDKLVLITPYASTIIEDKWNQCYPFTLTITFLYCLLLCAISGILFADSAGFICVISFLILNSIFILYEIAQIIATGTAYFGELLNWMDAIRGAVSTFWAVLLLYHFQPIKESDEMKYLTLVVVVLCYLRGFTYFRSFKMTRIFVYMTLAVVMEMYTFLIILWYSVLAFGIFSAVLLEFDSLADAWTNGYDLLMGNADNSSYGTVEWVVFTGATMTNVVIMLNLLVSILGDAYGNTQSSIRENDLHQQLELIIEYESMMFWRRNNESRGTVVLTCREANDASQGEDLQVKILKATNVLATSVEKVQSKVNEIEVKLHGMVYMKEGIEEILKNIGNLKKKVIKKVKKTTSKISQNTDAIAKNQEKVTGIEEKVAGMEGQLQAILGLLKPQS